MKLKEHQMLTNYSSKAKLYSLNYLICYSRVLECENELKILYNSGFKLTNLSTGLDVFFRIRTKLRSTYERLLVEEFDFSLVNRFDTKLWIECYEKPLNWIEEYSGTSDLMHLRKLRSLLLHLLDEGSTLFQLLLRCPTGKFPYNLSIYSAILLRKRENLTHSIHSRSFNLLQEAITSEPFKGFGYFTMAKWSLQDGDNLLALYWGLVALSVSECEITENVLEFLKTLSRNIAISPSFGITQNSENFDILNGQLVQMAAHSILSKFTRNSHLKHLDQLSHSQIPKQKEKKIGNLSLSLKYSITILWILVGLEQKNDNNNNLLQSCLLAKLFQIHLEFIEEASIFNIFIAFATNQNYSKFFTHKNYETLSKINNFAFESLNQLLKRIAMRRCDCRVDSDLYLDYFIFETFRGMQAGTGDIDLIGYFVDVGLYIRGGLRDDYGDDELEGNRDNRDNRDNLSTCTLLSEGTIQMSTPLLSSTLNDNLIIKADYDKMKKNERSMKLLTHRFLSTKLEHIQSTIEPAHLKWTIPDYHSLISNFPKIQCSILNRQVKILITLSVLEELDLDKNKVGECREIIRFLNERISQNDQCIRLLSNPISQGSSSPYSPSYRNKLALNHIKSVSDFYHKESKDIIIMCHDPSRYYSALPNESGVFFTSNVMIN